MPARKKARSSNRQEEASDSECSWQDEDADMAGFGQETRHLLEESDEPNEVETFPQSGRLRLRPDISLDGKYSGRKVSRKEAFSEASDEDEDNGEDAVTRMRDEDDDEDELVAGDLEVRDQDFEAVNREYEELQREEQELLNSLRGKRDDDAGKGEAVKHQKELWDKALDTRIGLQKLVTGSNRLAQLLNKNAESQVQESCHKLSSSAMQTLNSLLDLEDAIVQQNPLILETFEGAAPEDSKTEALEAAWERLTFSYSRLIPFRNRALDRWHRKTQISSGAAASRTKLKAFNQSISQQVANAMKDPTRLIARMVTGPTPDNEKESAEVLKMEADAFDDSEFYQQLLREFLESANSAGVGTLSYDAVRKLRSKKRKLVDRRASKGRKIRYTVHEPLVNFMVPEPMSLPPMATQLFTSLFGSKTNSAAGIEEGA